MCVSALRKEGRTLSHLYTRALIVLGTSSQVLPPMSSCWPARGHPCGDGGGVMACRHGGWGPRSFLLLLPRHGEEGERAGAVVACIVVGKTSFLRPRLSNRSCPENVCSSSSEEGEDSDCFLSPAQNWIFTSGLQQKKNQARRETIYSK